MTSKSQQKRIAALKGAPMSDQTISFRRGTQWATIEGREWALGADYDRLWEALTEIAKHDSSKFSVAHRRLVKIARQALSPELYVNTTSKEIALRRVCVWCNQLEHEITSPQCTAPDREGHLFRLSPHVPGSPE